MLKTIDRLIQFINHAGLSARQFDLSIGASNGYTLRMKKNRASIGSDVIENILRIYPQLNVVWLLTGEGTMLKEKSEPLPLDFDQLPSDKQKEIETIIENKIKERQRDELERLMKEIRSELKKT
ncbi:MAG: hypothetical protein HKO81_10710 [Flavobacteriaceae bacterium]|nr:hypothetical protein [Flavobacteriaceae bacterium]